MSIPSPASFAACREFSARRALCDSSVDYNSEDFRDRQNRHDTRDANDFNALNACSMEKEFKFSHRPIRWARLFFSDALEPIVNSSFWP